MITIELYSKKNIYIIIEQKDIFMYPQNDLQTDSFIGYLDVFHIGYKQLSPSEHTFLDEWSDGLTNEELATLYQVEIDSIYKRNQRLVGKIHNLLNEHP